MTSAIRTALLAAASLAGIAAFAAPAAPAKLPVIGGRDAVAVVNGEPILLDALKRTMDEIAADVAKGEGSPQDPMVVLERFVTAKLIAQEARATTLDDDPQFKSGVDGFRREAIRRAVLESPARKIRKADPKEMRRLLRLAKGAGRISSLMFPERQDADAFIARVAGGTDFDTAAAEATEAGKAVGHVPNGWVPLTDLRDQVAGIVAQLEPGEVTAPIGVKEGFTCVKLFEWSVPEDEKTLRQAEEEALTQQRLIAVGKFTEDIKNRYAKIDYPLVEALDFDAPEPGFASLKQDERVLVAVKGAQNVTVGDLARALEGRFFHGVKRAAERKQINKAKWSALDDIIVRRAALLEGRRLGLDKSTEVRAEVAEYEESQLFDLYVQRVVRPDVATSDDEVKAYFEEHRDDFKGPEILKLDQIAFHKRTDAEIALARLREGADFDFTRKNAPGAIPPGDDRVDLDVRGKELTRADLPEAARTSIEGARKGDLRIHDDAEEGVTYLLRVLDVVPPARLGWEFASDLARRSLVHAKIRATVDHVVGKLRAAADLDVFVTAESLPGALTRPSRPGR